MSIPGAKGPLLPARSNPVGPGITPGPGPGVRPPIGPRPSTPSQRTASVGGPPRREGSPAPMSSVAQRPRSMSLPPRSPTMPSPFGRPGPNSSMALNRPTLGGPKPIGQGGGQAQATSAASEAGESDSQVSQLLDQIEGMTRNLRELHQNGADKSDPKKLMEAVNKMLDMLADLSKKLDERMQAAGQSFAQAAQAQPQG